MDAHFLGERVYFTPNLDLKQWFRRDNEISSFYFALELKFPSDFIFLPYTLNRELEKLVFVRSSWIYGNMFARIICAVVPMRNEKTSV